MVLHVLLPVQHDLLLLRLPVVTVAAEDEEALLTCHAASGLCLPQALQLRAPV
jgi:hypothetical protein